MQKIRLLVHRDHASSVLERIQKIGAVELRDPSVTLAEETRTDFDANYEASRLDTAIDFLSRYEDVGTISKVLEGVSVHTNAASIEKTAHSYDYDPIVSEVQDIEAAIGRIDGERKELESEERTLRDCAALSIDIRDTRSTEYTHTYLLSVPDKIQQAFKDAITRSITPTHYERIGDHTFLLTVLQRHTDGTEALITEYGVETVTLPNRSGTPREALAAITERRQQLERDREDLEARAAALTTHLPQLRMVADYMHWKKERTEALYEHGRVTDRVVVFEGWCPHQEMDRLYHTIDSVTHAFELQQIESTDGEEPPVAIQNGTALLPFESVTRLYGMPSPRDLDPTLFLSGFFFISFGLCLTDVGYGIFLALVTGLILLLYRTQRGLTHLLALLMLGGIASVLVGLFFGGYFGVSMEYMPQWARDLQYFDPINAPLPFFYLTLIVGFLQIVAGTVIDIARQARNGSFTDGLLDNGPWLLFFLGIALYIGGAVAVIPASSVYVWIIGAAVIALILTQGRKKDSWLMKAFSGVMSLYNTVDYFSDVLSYSRLLALGLATSALAFSVNMIAVLLRDMVPVIGPLVMVIMLVVGHTFNLVVNVLGAYIHTARLQFVEFFGKFLSGTGKAFEPLARVERNVTLDKT